MKPVSLSFLLAVIVAVQAHATSGVAEKLRLPTAPNQPFQGQAEGWESQVRSVGLPPPFDDPNKVWTLPEMVDEALKRNPVTQQSWELANAAAAQVDVSKSAYMPTVSVGATGGASHSTVATYPGTQENNQINVSPQLQIQYLLLDFGARKASLSQSRFNLLSQNFSFNKVHQSVTLAVMTAYYNLEGARAALKNAESALSLSEATLSATEIKLKVGLGTSTDAAQARQNVEQNKFNLETARGVLSTAEVQLASSLGLPGNTKLQVAAPANTPSLAVLEQQVDILIDQAFRQRPDLAAKYNTWRAKLAAVDQAEASRWPTLNLGGNVQRTYYNADVDSTRGDFNGSGHTDNAAVSLSFSFDLFDGGNKSSQVQVARHTAEAARADLRNSELGVISDVVTNFVAFKTAAKQVDAAEALVESSQKSYESVRISHEHGLKNIIDLLTAQSNLAAARSTLSQARTSLFTASANLSNATGSLTSPSSGQPVAGNGSAVLPK